MSPSTADNSAARHPGPLAGRLILDCSILLPGPFVGKLLAARGAQVIKIENPSRPDPARGIGSFYAELNAGKEILALDIASPDGRRHFHELVRQADGLIEAFRPAAKRKLGLDERTLLDVNPKLCIGSIVGYPEDGDLRDRAGHDLNFQALSGMLSLFPETSCLPWADFFGAYHCALGLAAALDRVARGGPGGRVTTSLSDALLEVQSGHLRNFREHGEVPRPGQALTSGRYPCYRVYTAADGRRVAVGAIEPKFWQKVCAVLGVPELEPLGYAEGDAGHDAIARVQAALGAQPWAHWAPLFAAADCCVEPVLDYSEVKSHGL
jgi:crotonobetainyl-CoA:carnitine CoA-transferase CaiB-like acyl-CoA transferase